MTSDNHKSLLETLDGFERIARQSARILGVSSGSSQAIAELDRRRAAGESVRIFRDGKQWVVGPIPEEFFA